MQKHEEWLQSQIWMKFGPKRNEDIVHLHQKDSCRSCSKGIRYWQGVPKTSLNNERMCIDNLILGHFGVLVLVGSALNMGRGLGHFSRIRHGEIGGRGVTHKRSWAPWDSIGGFVISWKWKKEMYIWGRGKDLNSHMAFWWRDSLVHYNIREHSWSAPSSAILCGSSWHFPWYEIVALMLQFGQTKVPQMLIGDWKWTRYGLWLN